MQVTTDSLTYIYSYFCNDVYLISLNRGLFWNSSDTLNVVTKKYENNWQTYNIRFKEISDVCDQFIFGIKTQIQHNIFI